MSKKDSLTLHCISGAFEGGVGKIELDVNWVRVVIWPVSLFFSSAPALFGFKTFWSKKCDCGRTILKNKEYLYDPVSTSAKLKAAAPYMFQSSSGMMIPQTNDDITNENTIKKYLS